MGTPDSPDLHRFTTANSIEIWKYLSSEPDPKLSAKDCFHQTGRKICEVEFSESDEEPRDVWHLGAAQMVIDLELEEDEILLALYWYPPHLSAVVISLGASLVSCSAPLLLSAHSLGLDSNRRATSLDSRVSLSRHGHGRLVHCGAGYTTAPWALTAYNYAAPKAILTIDVSVATSAPHSMFFGFLLTGSTGSARGSGKASLAGVYLIGTLLALGVNSFFADADRLEPFGRARGPGRTLQNNGCKAPQTTLPNNKYRDRVTTKTREGRLEGCSHDTWQKKSSQRMLFMYNKIQNYEPFATMYDVRNASIDADWMSVWQNRRTALFCRMIQEVIVRRIVVLL
ncbi:hypothetical protein EDB84DRAFT_1660602 [Lactarius hengduanensis]|nr:hypothetical protein EDB84DRAFT_1660602 [Lactarius hengduanensis]